MTTNITKYKWQLPRDSNNMATQLVPNSLSVEATQITALTTHVLDWSWAWILELYTENETCVLKWGTTTITTTNYDAIIPVNQIRHLVIPNWVTNIMLAKYSDVTAPTWITVIEL